MELDFLRDKITIWDGAMGTVLQQRGLPPGGKPDLLNLTSPDLLYSIFREYIEAGSQIICAKKGVMSAGSHCPSFRYDPLKRVPPRPAKLTGSTLEEEAFTL